MKNLFLLIALVAAVVACDTEVEQAEYAPIVGGHYEGHFTYRDTGYWCLIQMADGRYEEWPSGGVWFQKSMGCLTLGSYDQQNDKIIFKADKFKFPEFPEACVPAMLLPGTYAIVYAGEPDSLVFKGGTGDTEIVYYLKKKKME